MDSIVFNNVKIYNVSDKIIGHSEGLDYDPIGSSYGEFTWEEQIKYLETINEHVCYIYDNAKVSLTNNLDFKAIEKKNKDGFDISKYRFFNNCKFSSDSTKVLLCAEMLKCE